ncbi:MAG: hypothetical protein ACJAZ5_000155 [Alloalcanivorax venustensis]|jgi:hypothetical protein|nr:MAG: hypothetical protein COA41_12335 [Sphingopyxis sp.]
MGRTPKKKPCSLRLEAELVDRIADWAQASRRSFAAEVGLLIDQGIEWRKENGNTIPGQAGHK